MAASVTLAYPRCPLALFRAVAHALNISSPAELPLCPLSHLMQSCNAVLVVRCPSGTCCGKDAGGKDQCLAPSANVCGGQTCCALQSDCSNPSNLRMYGRTCSSNCGTGVGADPLFAPSSYNVYAG